MDEQTIFLEALQKDSPAERSAFIEQACAGDEELRHNIQLLLRAHAKAGDFLQGEANGTDSTSNQVQLERPGTQIGPYKLLEQLGEGAFGVVYMAEQREPVCRKVALKILKPGMDTKQVIARFEAEGQALALMDHPNIAKVFDAGATNSGRPYFVMELVKGRPITEYCDAKELTAHGRLDLFISVCHAVQHAHQKGVIHRDIKPSNVLVEQHDDKPVVKVIDFGVAKAVSQPLTEKTLFTGFGQILGTLLYMSPEQAELNALDVDTRSDVYSLGVLLYELLTGVTPFDRKRVLGAAFDEMRRIIREEEPPKPSTRVSTLGNTATELCKRRQTEPGRLSALIRGDLDWIVMKALEKDRTRRYETASDFAKDVERYLRDDTVVARPPSITYHFRKFAKRNRATIVSLALVGFSLMVGAGVAFWGWHQADQQTEVARKEADRANAEHDRVAEILQDWNQSLFAKGVTDVFSGNGQAARAIVAQLREQDGEDLAEQLEILTLFFGGPHIDEVKQRLQTFCGLHPDAPGSYALLMLSHLGCGDYRLYSEGRRKLEDMLAQEERLSAIDSFFVGCSHILDTKRSLEYLDHAFEQSPSPVFLLYRGRVRSDYALHAGNAEAALRAIEDAKAARLFLGDAIPIRLQGLATYLIAANAMKAQGREEDYSRILAEAGDLTPAIREKHQLLRWERFFLAEYHCETGKKSEAAALLDGEPQGGWRDYESYLLLALAYELKKGRVKFARENHVGPFAKAGMAMGAGLRGEYEEASRAAEGLLDEKRVPEVINIALDARILARTPLTEIESIASTRKEGIDANTLDWRGRGLVDHSLKIYAEPVDAKEELSWASNSEYPNFWLTHVHWALAMRSLAENDYVRAKQHFENVCRQRVIYLGQYLWARALLANWDDFVTSRGA